MNLKTYIPWLVTLLATHLMPWASAAVRDYYEEPGLQKYQVALGDFNESISAFGGTIQLHNTDLSLPMNGGLDVSVMRTYTSVQATRLPTLSGLLGLGWDLHYGRLVVSAQSYFCEQEPPSTPVPPIFELPDGGQQQFYRNTVFSGVDYISKDNWKIDCNGANKIITAPNGSQYHLGFVAGFNSAGETIYLVDHIEDVHANSIDIQYSHASTGLYQIDSITSSEVVGPVVRFTNHPDGRIQTMTAYGKTWTFSYEAIGGSLSNPNHAYFLTRVIQPDQTSWFYDYYRQEQNNNPLFPEDQAGPGSYSIKSYKLPTGATTTFSYQNVFFNQVGDRSTTEQRTTVIRSKTVSGPDITSGLWSYDFAPHSVPGPSQYGLTLKYDQTTVTSPSGVEEYQHFGKGFEWRVVDESGQSTFYTHYFYKWSIGLPVKKTIRSLSGQTLSETDFGYSQRLISHDQFYHGFLGHPAQIPEDPRGNEEVFAALLSSVAEKRDGNAYYSRATSYMDPDAYGNMQTVREGSNYLWHDNALNGAVNNQDGGRYTLTQFRNDPAHWVIGLVETSDVAINGEVRSTLSNQFNALNEVVSTTIDGITTDYSYHPTGELYSTTDAQLNTTIYDDYKRGVAQSLAYPENITEFYSVNDDGTLASYTNGENERVDYAYDSMNRIQQITFPEKLPVNISYQANSRQLTRGNLQITDHYNATGQLQRNEVLDATGSEAIITTKRYDAQGQLQFSSLPNSALGQGYRYDALGRTTQLIDPDGQSTVTLYQDDRVLVTDANGHTTTRFYRTMGLNDNWLVRTDQPENVSTFVSYDALGQLLRSAQGTLNPDDSSLMGFEKFWHYNDRMQLDYQASPEEGTTNYFYDELGTLAGMQHDGQGRVTYIRDGLGRITTIDYPTPTDDSFISYDRANRILSEETGLSKKSFRYDSNGNTIEILLDINAAIPRHYRLDYRFNDLDYVSGMTYPDGLSVDYQPDFIGRPTQIRGFVNSIHYSPNGQLQDYSLTNGMQPTFDYHPNSRLKRIQDGNVDNTYEYDAVGNITGKINRFSQGKYYGYNGLNQLQWERWLYSNGRFGSYFNYEMNATGNILYSKGSRNNYVTSGYQYDNNHRLIEQYSRYGVGTKTLSYSPDGMLKQADNNYYITHYTFDAARRLVHVRNKYIAEQHSYGVDAMRTFSYNYSPTFNMSEYYQRAEKYDLQYEFHSPDGQLLFDEQFNKCRQSSYIYLAGRLITRAQNVSTRTPNQDSDNDGMNDCFEIQFGLDPLVADSEDDIDQDGLTNWQEFEAGANPLLADSDQDGVSDADEASRHSDPLVTDTDHDGLSDLTEFTLGTDPTHEDSDSDGFSDYDEIQLGYDPLSQAEGLMDSDQDGYSNRQEILAGFDWQDGTSFPEGMSQVLWQSFTPAPRNYYLPSRYGASVQKVTLHPNGKLYIGNENAFEEVRTDGDVTVIFTHENQNDRFGYRAYDIRPSIYGDNLLIRPYNKSYVDYNIAQGTANQFGWVYTYNHTLIVLGDQEVISFTSWKSRPDWPPIYRTGAELWHNGTRRSWYLPSRYGDFQQAQADYHGNYYLGDDEQTYIFDAEHRALGTLNYIKAFGIDNSVYVDYYNSAPNRNPEQYRFSKLSLAGTFIWGTYDIIRSATASIDGSVYVAGHFGLKKYAADGTLLWHQNEIVTEGSVPDFILTDSGNIWLMSELGIKKLDDQGQLLESLVLPLSSAGSMEMDVDGTLYIRSGLTQLFAVATTDSKRLSSLAMPSTNSLCYNGTDYAPADQDTDSDGLSDCFESLFMTELDGSDDADQDGLSNAEEFQLGSSFLLADTDLDGRTDGEELAAGSSLLLADSDGDDITDGQEFELASDLFSADFQQDSDLDGVSDIVERTFGTDIDSPADYPLEGSIKVIEENRNGIEEFSSSSMSRLYEGDDGIWHRGTHTLSFYNHSGRLIWSFPAGVRDYFEDDSFFLEPQGKLIYCGAAFNKRRNRMLFGLTKTAFQLTTLGATGSCADLGKTTAPNGFRLGLELVNGDIASHRYLNAYRWHADTNVTDEVLAPCGSMTESLVPTPQSGFIASTNYCFYQLNADNSVPWSKTGPRLSYKSRLMGIDAQLIQASGIFIVKYDEQGQVLWTYEHPTPISELSLSLGGNILFASDNQIVVLNPQGVLLRTLPAPGVDQDARLLHAQSGLLWIADFTKAELYAMMYQDDQPAVPLFWPTYFGPSSGSNNACVTASKVYSTTDDTDGNGQSDCLDYAEQFYPAPLNPISQPQGGRP